MASKIKKVSYREKIEFLKRLRDSKKACNFINDRDVIVLDAIIKDVELKDKIDKIWLRR